MWENKLFRVSLSDKAHKELMEQLDRDGYEVVGIAAVGVTVFVLAKRRVEALVS